MPLRRGDDPTPPVPFDELRPDRTLDAWRVDVRPATIARLRTGLGLAPDPHAAAPDVLAGNLTVGAMFAVLPRSILHVRQSVRCVRPVQPGSAVESALAVRAVGRRGGRAAVRVAGDWRDARCGDVCWTVCADAVVPGVADDVVAALDPFPPSEPPDVAAPDADHAATHRWSQRCTLDAMTAFSGPGNVHSDPAVARRFGWDRPVVQGMHLAGLLLDGAVARCAPGTALRSFAVRFRAPVLADDVVACTAACDVGGVVGRIDATATTPDGATAVTLRAEVG